MRKQYKIVLLTAAALSAMCVAQVRAEAQYHAVGSDGIAASPKVRVMLNHQQPTASQPKAVAQSTCCEAAPARTSVAAAPCCGHCCGHANGHGETAATK
ncbi:MAG TPA: hypothetical protein VMU04_08055 [Candidatus Acidoferrum sp.]|nr:hypothetical protein [Candidatus Acidoferrum sp.]